MSIDIAKIRMVAPALYKFPGHSWASGASEESWAWNSLQDLVRLFNRSPVEIWELYAAEAKAVVERADWNGKTWLFVVLTEGGWEISPVWDQKTGDRAELSEQQLNNVFLPGGWMRGKVKLAERIARAFENALRQPWVPERLHVSRAVEEVGTFQNLQLLYSYILQTTECLELRMVEYPDRSLIELEAKSRSDTRFEASWIVAEIRLVLAKLKIQDVKVARKP
jgi:hypothetical protein